MFIRSCEKKYIISDESSSSYDNIRQDHLKGMSYVRSAVHIGDSSGDKVFGHAGIIGIFFETPEKSLYCQYYGYFTEKNGACHRLDYSLGWCGEGI